MKTLILAAATAAVLVLTAGAVLANDNAAATPPAPGGQQCEKGMHHGMWWSEKLNLTPDQRAKVKEILSAAREQAKAAPDRAARMKIRYDAFEKIKTTILNDQQRQELQAEMHERMQHRLAGLEEKLGLTPEQRDKVKAIFDGARDQVKAAVDHVAKAKIWREAWDKVKETVLTAEQRVKLSELHAKCQKHRPAPETTPAEPPASNS